MQEQENLNPVSLDNIPQYIKLLISKDANASIVPDESKDLIEWLEEDKANWELFQMQRKLCAVVVAGNSNQ